MVSTVGVTKVDHMEPLSLPARSALLVLMTLGDAVPNSRIREKFGLVIEKSVREELETNGYIDVTPGPRRSNLHELTEEGWKACRAELRADAPAKAPPAYRLLYPVLNLFERHLTATKATLADVVLANDEAAAPLPEADAEVRSVYRALAKNPGDQVSLTHLREQLQLPREIVDEALLRLDLLPEVQLTAEVNQKNLSDVDRTAAIRIGNQDKHLLAINPS
jgi:DNA-binding MarR family transcriptional regulator